MIAREQTREEQSRDALMVVRVNEWVYYINTSRVIMHLSRDSFLNHHRRPQVSDCRWISVIASLLLDLKMKERVTQNDWH